MLILATQSLYASVSIAENIKLYRDGARRQPCFTPLETGKDFDESSYYYNYTKAIIVIITSGTDKSKLESFYTMYM